VNESSRSDRDRSPGLDESLQREIEEALGGKSIEDLLDEGTGARTEAARGPGRGPVQPGDIVPCRVVAIDRDTVLVEMGGKDQGMLPLEQFEQDPAPGEVFQLEVVRYDRNEDLWVVSRAGAVERATWDDLAEGTVVEAFVDRANKGGLEVSFQGIHAFMPVSQISMYRVEKPEEFVGQKLKCLVTEVKRRERRVIVSARALMEQETAEKKEALLAELAEGDVREGVVRQIMPFGAFVDLGGVDGLVHVSQMSYSRVENPGDLVRKGQTVTVQVLKIDLENDRISLGMKQTQPDPWETAEAKYSAGSIVTGRVTKLESFGAFVELEPGVEGLIPISEMTWTHRPRHAGEVVEVGQTVQPLVLQVDMAQRRISLSLKQTQANPWAGASSKYPTGGEVVGTVKRIAEFGAFVELEAGVEGLVHISELSDEHVRRVEDVVQVGQPVTVRIRDVDEPARRISLTMRGFYSTSAAEAAPREKPKKKRKRPLRGGLD